MTEPPADEALRWKSTLNQFGTVVFFFLVGCILVFAPDTWFGPTWSYFQYLPHGGFGLGATWLGLGLALLVGILFKSKRFVSVVYLFGGVSLYIAAWLIALQGIAGKTGLMESPFMMYAGIDMIIESVVIRK